MATRAPRCAIRPASAGAAALLEIVNAIGLRATARTVDIDKARLSRILAGTSGITLHEAVAIESIYHIAPKKWTE